MGLPVRLQEAGRQRRRRDKRGVGRQEGPREGGTEVVFEAYGFRLYKDGHVVRSGREDRAPACFDAETGVTSKDVVVDATTGVTARLYLPTIQTSSESEDKKLPVVVFLHGGNFIVGSPAEPIWSCRFWPRRLLSRRH